MPVVATTVDLLTTGVDIPSVRNIVFLRTLSSVVLFNQIIGRGTRIDEASGKYFFRIIDYTGATRLFSKLKKELPPLPPGVPSDYFLKGYVYDAETQLPIEGARAIVIARPNEQLYATTDKDGFFTFHKLPRKVVTLIISKSEYVRRELKAPTAPDLSQVFNVALYKERAKRKPIVIDKIPVHIETEEEIMVEAGGKLLKKAEYRQYSKEGIREKVVTLEDLKGLWLDDEKRQHFLDSLSNLGISPQVLSSVILQRSDIDSFDVLAHIAFDAPIISRDERAKTIISLKQKFIESYSPEGREVILDLIDQYRIGGVEELRPEVLTIHRFTHKYGGLKTIIERLKIENLVPLFNQIKENIYI